MRPVTVLLAFCILPFMAPPAVATSDTASFSTTLPCIAGDAFFLGAGIALPGCSFTHAGTAHVNACADGTCSVTIVLHAQGAGLPPGIHALATTSDDDAGAGVATVCSTLEPSAGATVTCDAKKQVTIDITSDCRFLTVSTSGTLDVKAAGAELVDTFRVCADATGISITQG